jgi:acetylcholinesterase
MPLGRPRITLRQGTFLGTEIKGSYPQIIEQFLGIPFALSTAGERRFKPPLRINASTATFDASRYGQRCPSGPSDGVQMGEDCLNANIYRPKIRNSSKKLPVLIYVHGGAFNFGSGRNRSISSLVAWSVEPMIGISFNYRTGAWVQDNVVEFGGDLNNVTLMGDSAGAHSVCSSYFFKLQGLNTFYANTSQVLSLPSAFGCSLSLKNVTELDFE